MIWYSEASDKGPGSSIYFVPTPSTHHLHTCFERRENGCWWSGTGSKLYMQTAAESETRILAVRFSESSELDRTMVRPRFELKLQHGQACIE